MPASLRYYRSVDFNDEDLSVARGVGGVDHAVPTVVERWVRVRPLWSVDSVDLHLHPREDTGIGLGARLARPGVGRGGMVVMPLGAVGTGIGMAEDVVASGAGIDQQESAIGMIRIGDDERTGPVGGHVPSVDFGNRSHDTGAYVSGR